MNNTTCSNQKKGGSISCGYRAVTMDQLDMIDMQLDMAVGIIGLYGSAIAADAVILNDQAAAALYAAERKINEVIDISRTIRKGGADHGKNL